MTTTLQNEPSAPAEEPLEAAQLPRSISWYVLGGAVVVSGALTLLLGWNLAAFGVVAVILYLIAIYVISRVVEGRRKATNRLMTGLVTTAFILALLPLVAVVWTVVDNGWSVMSAEFFTSSMRNVIGEGGGIYHAIWGTLIITGLSTLISVPIGLMTGIYLVEYGRGALARQITFLVDVMTGIPSIVAGLFAYALFELFFGPGIRMGIGGAVALSLLMTPIIVRSTEEMLKLVPDELREASLALGVPKWRTIVKVVLPTAIAGIITGITIGIARVIGETAPLLIIAGSTDSVNFNPFSEQMMTLPVFTYFSYKQPGVPPEFGIDRAWRAAFVLILIVLVLNLVARLVSYWFSPKVKS